MNISDKIFEMNRIGYHIIDFHRINCLDNIASYFAKYFLIYRYLKNIRVIHLNKIMINDDVTNINYYYYT